MSIIVTGGTGYIGSHTIVDLIQNGYEVICIDDLSRSNIDSLQGIENITGVEVPFVQLDLTRKKDVLDFFETQKNIEGIIHFAAYKAVGESVEEPLMYYENNLFSLINLLHACQINNIKNFIFSSSCSVYGNAEKLPVDESTPLQPAESPYGATKQMGEQIIIDTAVADETSKYILLRYFNPVGAHPSAEIGELSIGRPNNLVPVITQTAIGLNDKMYVWGDDYDTRDGTAVRDYIHVMDIAHAHTLAMKHILENQNESNLDIFNLGSGNGVTVLEAILAFEKVSGIKLNYEIGPRREGDVEAVYADNTKAKKILHWNTQYDISDMMSTAWKWQKKLEENTIDE